MLKIKKLQIQGFKSFCDRTELQFPGHGVAGVVGPNGCGKSNVADAIGWVLGEQSVKSLRGQRMEDVIFAGSRDRTASGLAEVSLTLIDPEVYQTNEDVEDPAIEIEDGWETAETAPASAGPVNETVSDADGQTESAVTTGAVVLSIRKRRKFPTQQRAGEVVVTRRLFRSGDSEYLLNGRPCRLRDIQDIFMGTGLGPESYAIIEQGRIGQLLAAKPYERRSIIEEAAGVTKYKAKRKLAEAKLESARQNLARINDIFEEVTRQMASLKRQAAKARRYGELKAEHDHKLRYVLVSQAGVLGRQQTECQAEFEQLRGEAEAAQGRVRQLDADRAQTQQTAQEHEVRLRAAEMELNRLTLECDRAQSQMAFHRQQIEDLARQQTVREAALQGLAGQRAELSEEQSRLGQDSQALAGEVETARMRHQEACAASQREAQLAAELEQQSEALRLRLLQTLSEISALGHQAAENEAAAAVLDRQLTRCNEEQTAARAEAEAHEARRRELEANGHSLQQTHSELARRQAAVAEQLTAAREELRQLKPRREELRARKADAQARCRSLEEMIAHHGYSSEAVRNLFQPAGQAGGFRPLGVLADFLEVDPAYEAVVEEFLRDELNYVVVHNWDEADAGLGIVRQDAQGRVTFLVHPQDGQYSMFSPGEIGAGPDPEAGGGERPLPLKKCVRILNGFGQSLEHILPKLGSGYIVPQGELARRLAGENPRAYFLTAQGECFHRQTVSGGVRSGVGPLSLKRELRETTRNEEEVRENLEKLELRITALEAELAAAEGENQALQAGAHEVEKETLANRQLLEQAGREWTRAMDRQRQLAGELERGQNERRATEARLETLRQQRLAADQARNAAETEQQQLADASHAARLRREEAGQHQAATQSELARLEERSLALTGQLQRLEARLRDLEQQALRHQQEAEEAERRRQELSAAILASQEAVAVMTLQRDQQAELQAKEATALDAQRARLRELEPEIQALRTTWDGLRERQNGCEVRLARMASDLEHLAQTFLHDLGQELSPDLIPAEIPDAAVIAAAAEEVRELHNRIEHLGPVNLMALEEFQETEQRHQFLETQRKDLFDSIADTQKAIQEIDTVTRQQFAEAFEKINAYFQETFRTLFGGGQGFLRLTDAENNPEGGVDIVAQPPGKKLQNAMLLSGGEKAMTALALLVAVFRFQPSPFCVLDEVDAPLDDANIGRFTQMVREMSAQTQFIIITHSRKTMEIAPLLYGVTMPQSGVSRIVSVRLEEAVKRAG